MLVNEPKEKKGMGEQQIGKEIKSQAGNNKIHETNNWVLSLPYLFLLFWEEGSVVGMTL